MTTVDLRPPVASDSARAGITLAVDIGGTKIAGALVREDGTLLVSARRPTPRGTDGDGVMAALEAVVAELAAASEWAGVRRCGIGSAGPIDASRGTVSPVNIGAWRDYPVLERTRALLARHGAPVPTVLVGDGVAMTAAEHWLGAARGHRNALCMVVSTGVGGGLVLDGRLHPGPTGNAGHIGHISVELDGEPCPCGSRGCVEIIASGTSIARHAGLADAAAAAEAARAGDPAALAAFDRAGRALAAAIAGTATLVEIDICVIGGGVAAAGDLLFGPLRQHLKSYAALSFVSHLEITTAALGTDAGLVGAAAAAGQLL
ncbi:ROK family protein [Streptomyces sp. TRM66268-LWL]|uniref:ROK family protein n=1 Tax=Streptomyces polyasparticus TaxID=2767826 RepID=A0ABR7SD77_9ACTN|nr:ROK family protein [Streptomyces polyasparticus]MBC9712934.1 ROK family protein [Streptomyces polyasparticus]